MISEVILITISSIIAFVMIFIVRAIIKRFKRFNWLLLVPPIICLSGAVMFRYLNITLATSLTGAASYLLFVIFTLSFAITTVVDVMIYVRIRRERT